MPTPVPSGRLTGGACTAASSVRDNKSHVIERPADGLGSERVLLQGEGGMSPQPVSVSRDGRWLVVRTGGAGQSAISFLSLADGKTVTIF